MLSQTAEYALRAAVRLAELHPEGPIRVDDIAADLRVPRNYLSKILHSLVKAGVCASTRGPHGGFQLVRPPDQIRLVEVVGEFDPALVSSERACLLGREACSDEDPCAAHERWGGVRQRVTSFFEETTLDLLGRGGAALPAGN